MASSINLGYALWLDGSSINALLGRQNHVAASFYSTGAGGLQVRSGVLPGSGQLAITPGSGMQVLVAAGACVVANSSGSTYGGYLFSSMSSGSLTVAASSLSNPRIDLVCATVSDVGSSSSFAELQILTGTPAASPVAPALPGNSLSLATIFIPANSTSISSGNITTTGTLTVAVGGIIPTAAAAAPAGYNGAYIHDTGATFGTLKHNSAAGVVQARVLPFAPALVTLSSNIVMSAFPGVTTVTGTGFSSDGVTQWQFTISGSGFASNGPLVTHTLTLNGGTVWQCTPSGSGSASGNFFQTVFTSATIGTTPINGSNVLNWTAQMTSSGTVTLTASSAAPMQLRASPVSL